MVSNSLMAGWSGAGWACFRSSFHYCNLFLSLSLSLPPLADLNNIKFSAYRTAMKLRRVQKALRCTLSIASMVFSVGMAG